MIVRIWHGWTTVQNADAYERLLRQEIFTGIEARAVPGFQGIELLRRDVADGVEFVTIMRFDSLDAVRAFAGDDYEVAVVPAAARRLLARFDQRSAHYELAESRQQGPSPASAAP
jgi:heme-degrading monooxygenase HmoA